MALKRPDVKRPMIFAHRGACRVAPENTLPAFEAAIRLGADGVELDVQYSSDGQLVIFHGMTLETSSNGTGRVTALTFNELRALDAGAWFKPEFAGTRIPTLQEALELLKGKLLVNIELKALDFFTVSIASDVVAAVRDQQMQDQVVISSFNPVALRRAKKAGPEIETGLLLAADLPPWMHSKLARMYSRADGLHPDTAMVDEAYMARAARRRTPVRVWTVNEEPDMRRLIDLGVDAIITDVPDVLARLLQ